MPLALAFIGAIFIVAGIRGTYPALFSQLATDMPGFALWLAAILAIGIIGYIPKAELPSRMLLGLVLLVMVIANKGAFANFVAAFKSPAQVPTTQPAPSPLGPLPISLGQGSTSAGGAGGGASLGGIIGGALPH